MLNAAIIGLGRWGQLLVESVQEGGRPKGGHIRFTRAVTRTPANAAAFADRQKLPVSGEYASVLEDPEIAAVVIATPHSQHADQIEAAAKAGKHVFVEKPMTLDKAGAERAVAACRAAGVVLAPGHNRRFYPSTQALKALIDGDALGTILHVDGNFSGPLAFGYIPGVWRADAAENPAGGMAAMGIHMVDAMIHLCGPIEAVRAQSQRRVLAIDTDDTTSALLRFAGGMTGTLATIIATPRLWRIQVFGSKGWAHVRAPGVMDVHLMEVEPETRTFPAVDIERAELEAFATAVAGGAAYPITADEAVHGVAVFEAIAASATRQGDLVKVP
jgi:predicted dehydrogenase